MEEKSLHHIWCEPLEAFFARIDKFGGWPVEKRFVGFVHTKERKAGFTDEPIRHGWWTTICSSDEYYRWKLSPEAIAKIHREERRRIIRKLGGMGG